MSISKSEKKQIEKLGKELTGILRKLYKYGKAEITYPRRDINFFTYIVQTVGGSRQTSYPDDYDELIDRIKRDIEFYNDLLKKKDNNNE